VQPSRDINVQSCPNAGCPDTISFPLNDKLTKLFEQRTMAIKLSGIHSKSTRAISLSICEQIVHLNAITKAEKLAQPDQTTLTSLY
jgi:hypothetical protein